jgi:hypothetical protein
VGTKVPGQRQAPAGAVHGQQAQAPQWLYR